VYLFSAIVGMIGTILVAIHYQPRLRRPRINVRVGKSMLTYGGALTLSGLASIPLTTADRLLLAHYTSPVVVAYYAIASRLGTLLSAIPSAIAGPLFPALVALEGGGHTRSARSLYQQSLRGTFLVLTPALLTLAFLSRPFLSLWAGPAYGQHSTDPFYVLLAGVWFNSLAYMPYAYLLASGRTGLIARIHVFEVLPYIGLAAVLTSQLGALGAALVWSLRVSVDSICFFWCARRAGGLPFSPLSSRTAASALAPAVLAVILLSLTFVTSSFASRLAWVSVIGSAYGALVVRTVLTPREREGLRSLGRDLVPHLHRRRTIV
jgi:O-antigen/teichoic acid export membrane protein